MLKQFPITELIKQIQATIKAGTGKKCYDHVEKNQKAPLYMLSLSTAVRQTPKRCTAQTTM